MVKFGGKIGTLYQMLKNAFKKHPLQNRTNVQIKGGGGKGLLNNVKKNCTFLKWGLPLCLLIWVTCKKYAPNDKKPTKIDCFCRLTISSPKLGALF